jgi:hypothetical protein
MYMCVHVCVLNVALARSLTTALSLYYTMLSQADDVDAMDTPLTSMADRQLPEQLMTDNNNATANNSQAAAEEDNDVLEDAIVQVTKLNYCDYILTGVYCLVCVNVAAAAVLRVSGYCSTSYSICYSSTHERRAYSSHTCYVHRYKLAIVV